MTEAPDFKRSWWENRIPQLIEPSNLGVPTPDGLKVFTQRGNVGIEGSSCALWDRVGNSDAPGKPCWFQRSGQVVRAPRVLRGTEDPFKTASHVTAFGPAEAGSWRRLR